MLPNKEVYFIFLTIYVLAASSSVANSQDYTSSADKISTLIKSLVPAEDGTSNLNDGVLLLIPTNFNLTESLLSESDFSLFKLNTDALLSDVGFDQRRIRRSAGSSLKSTASDDRTRNPRAARKINLFRNLFNKQKFSPLYLVNGTVCRFSNTGPICTTISTNGIQAFMGGGGGGGFNSQGLNQQQPFGGSNLNQQQQQQQQQQFNTNQQQQTTQQQQPFNNNQQFRPAGLMDAGIPFVNVANVTSRVDLSKFSKKTTGQKEINRINPTPLAQHKTSGLFSIRRPKV